MEDVIGHVVVIILPKSGTAYLLTRGIRFGLSSSPNAANRATWRCDSKGHRSPRVCCDGFLDSVTVRIRQAAFGTHELY